MSALSQTVGDPEFAAYVRRTFARIGCLHADADGDATRCSCHQMKGRDSARPNVNQADRDALDDHDVVRLDDCVGTGPHALDVAEAVAQ